ncbi:hypothetical protein BC673_10166 [Prevotella pallens]|uniref:Uncharacterized protein n=2 Tax=Prevotella pallens TaxID=60133 RepID=A0ABX9DW53_9BACT|nr:hypothetical protein BC673_10166 [Prevotella pallens]
MRNGYIIDVVEKILFLNNIYANRKELLKVLFSSPVFPSLASISQTLSYYGLHNNAFVAVPISSSNTEKHKYELMQY